MATKLYNFNHSNAEPNVNKSKPGTYPKESLYRERIIMMMDLRLPISEIPVGDPPQDFSVGHRPAHAQTLRNITPFFEAFSITEGQPLYLASDKQVVIW